MNLGLAIFLIILAALLGAVAGFYDYPGNG